MPRRKKGGAGVGGGGGSGGNGLANVVEAFSGGGEGDTTMNPYFGAKPGDITPSYTGDPSSLSQKLTMDNRGFWDKLAGKKDASEGVNNAYILQTALQKYGQQLATQTGKENAPQINPDFESRRLGLGISHDFTDKNFDADVDAIRPYTGNSLGSVEGNAKYIGEGAMKDLADKSALQQLVNAQKITQQGYQPLEQHTQRMFYAGAGIDPSQSSAISPVTQNAFTSARSADTAGNMLKTEEALGQIPTANETSSLNAQNKLAALNDPNFQSSFITGQLAQNLHPSIVNQKMQEVNVPANDTVYTPNKEYHGQSVVAAQIPKPPLKMPDGKGGFMDIPQSGMETVHNVTPSFVKNIVPIGAKANPNPPVMSAPSQDRGAVIPRSTQLQAPNNQLDLSMNPDVIPSRTAPKANKVSPYTLLLQQLSRATGY